MMDALPVSALQLHGVKYRSLDDRNEGGDADTLNLVRVYTCSQAVS